MKHTKNGELYTAIILEIFKLNGGLVSAGDELLKDLGVTSARWKVLGALHISEEPMTVSKISSVMGQTRQGVQRLTDIMVQEGLMEYSENPYHKKAKLVSMTDSGRELYKEIDRRQIEWSNALSEKLNTKEIETALRVLRDMYQDL